jgi:hypothetical protein
MSPLQTRFIAASEVRSEQTWQLLDWCRSSGADEFALSLLGLEGYTTPFTARLEAALAPFHLPAAVREQVTVYSREDVARLTQRWALTSESVTLLQEFFDQGLFTYPVGEWEIGCIEDPIVYRNGDVMLGIVSHERRGVLVLTELEHAEVAALGIHIRPEPPWI